MPEGSYQYCDVSLPVPVDQLFTYELPETLRHRVQPGSRLMVPFGHPVLTINPRALGDRVISSVQLTDSVVGSGKPGYWLTQLDPNMLAQ